MTTARDAAPSSLDLDDIQSGVLHPRPSPYVGTYLLLRIDDRAAGRTPGSRLRSPTRA
jgi:deferrochelatase/peroxidase EfeB